MAKRSLLGVFHSFDKGPTENFAEFIVPEASRRGWGISFLGNGTSGMADHISRIEGVNPGFDFLMTGLSTGKTRIGEKAIIFELSSIQECVARGKPAFVLADSYRSVLRPEASGNVEGAIAICASPIEVEEAKAFGYKDAVYLGPPPRWQKIRRTRPANIYVTPDQTVVVVGGTKSAELTDMMLESFIRAIDGLRRKCLVIFKPHPKEESTNALRRKSLFESSRFVQFEDVQESTSQLIASDRPNLFVFMPGSTGVIECACWRRRVVVFQNEQVLDRLEAQTGARIWDPIRLGLAIPSKDDGNLFHPLRSLFVFGFSDVFQLLRKNQVTAFPDCFFEEFGVEERILDYVERIVAV